MSTKETLDFLVKVKSDIKQNKYRQKFDALYREYENNIVNTSVVRGKIDQSQTTSVQLVTIRPDGSTDFAVMPRVNRFDDSISQTPRSAEAISFSKIITATSAVASQIPDGTTYSMNKIKARAYYELYKRSWALPEANGTLSLQITAQNIVGLGWGAWRVYPKTDVTNKTIKGKKTRKIIFDDLFREPLHPKRTWLGLSYRPDVSDGRPEVYYEIDITKERFAEMKKLYKVRSLNGYAAPTSGVTMEAMEDDTQKSTTHVTLCFYENPLMNRMIIATDDTCFYDDEMPNDEVYGSVVVGNCFMKNQDDPYGVGYFELMRGNETIYNYINSLTTEQVEAEVAPLLFASGVTGQGDLTFKRSAFKLNQLPAGAKVDKINTTGNATLAINYADKQKNSIEENTGINNIVSGASSDQTLGGTVILKEAALARLTIPRNSLKQMIEHDFCISASWFEQDQGEFREYIFSTEEEALAFQAANPMHHMEMDDTELDSEGIPVSYKILTSGRVPVSFDYSQSGLVNSNYQDQNIQELGSPSLMLSKNAIIGGIKHNEAGDKIGYDKVIFKVDPNSMLVPSIEIEKQSAMQLFPIIQNSITIIYGLSKQDPEQAKTQLVALKKFVELQRQNIYDYVPKEQYDAITQGMNQQTPQDLIMKMMGGLHGMPTGSPTQSDGTDVTAPQNPQEVGSQQSPMMASMQGSLGKLP